MGIDGNEIADQLARQGPSHPLTGPEPALGISEKVARGMSSGWKSRKHKEYWQSICEQRKVNSFLKGTSEEEEEKNWGINQLEQKPAKNNDGAAKRELSFKRTCI
jgi:ribonuclease HI